MSICVSILLVYAAGFIGLQILLAIATFLMDNLATSQSENKPVISVLIAARNEEKNILACLQSIVEMDYPHEKLEILIGNDQSTDRTEKLVLDYIKEQQTSNPKITIKLEPIIDQLGKARAKANVLAHLARKAQGEYFFITDADIIVNRNWAGGILKKFKEKVGIVSGTTIIQSEKNILQKWDWLYFSSLLKGICNLSIPVTAVGNNMAVKREAYFATGGYENIDFSVTEDLKLYNAIRKKGYQSANLLDTESLNYTSPISDIKTLFNQRKRWLVGAKDLSFFAQLILFYHGLFPWILLLFFICNWEMAVLFWATKYIIQYIYIIVLARYIKQPIQYLQLIIYEFLQVGFNLALSVYYILPIKFFWKGRNY